MTEIPNLCMTPCRVSYRIAFELDICPLLSIEVLRTRPLNSCASSNVPAPSKQFKQLQFAIEGKVLKSNSPTALDYTDSRFCLQRTENWKICACRALLGCGIHCSIPYILVDGKS